MRISASSANKCSALTLLNSSSGVVSVSLREPSGSRLKSLFGLANGIAIYAGLKSL